MAKGEKFVVSIFLDGSLGVMLRPFAHNFIILGICRAHEALRGLLDYVAGKDWTQQPEAKRKKTENSWHPLSKALSDSHGASPCTAAACAWRALQADSNRAALEKHIKSSQRLAVSARRTAVAEELAALDGGCTLQDMVPDCC